MPPLRSLKASVLQRHQAYDSDARDVSLLLVSIWAIYTIWLGTVVWGSEVMAASPSANRWWYWVGFCTAVPLAMAVILPYGAFSCARLLGVRKGVRSLTSSRLTHLSAVLCLAAIAVTAITLLTPPYIDYRKASRSLNEAGPAQAELRCNPDLPPLDLSVSSQKYFTLPAGQWRVQAENSIPLLETGLSGMRLIAPLVHLPASGAPCQFSPPVFVACDKDAPRSGGFQVTSECAWEASAQWRNVTLRRLSVARGFDKDRRHSITHMAKDHYGESVQLFQYDTEGRDVLVEELSSASEGLRDLRMLVFMGWLVVSVTSLLVVCWVAAGDGLPPAPAPQEDPGSSGRAAAEGEPNNGNVNNGSISSSNSSVPNNAPDVVSIDIESVGSGEDEVVVVEEDVVVVADAAETETVDHVMSDPVASSANGGGGSPHPEAAELPA